MTKTDLDRKILEAIAVDPGITISSVTKLLKECTSDETIRQHIYRLAARRYLRLGNVAALYPLTKGIAAIRIKRANSLIETMGKKFEIECKTEEAIQ